ncbi:porin [Arcobacter sp. LA11]|uniref:porin n=1 Tax=Arcobacter sp. LA11 TaxID=1898176 RepID=UPI00093556A4|nr:porin [Arcobacter sp. LA11]
MKKFAKMSLVAAIAVAGTVASAQPLAEAIKNVDVSGTVVYRYNDKNFDDGDSTVDNNYKVAVSLKSKVTDDVTFNSRFIAGGDNGGFIGLDTQGTGDGGVGVELTWANFAYTGIANTTVIVGKQGLGLPWFKATDSDGTEQTGTGILAMTTMGPVTAAAGYFNQTNVTAGKDAIGTTADVALSGTNVMIAALMGSFGPVKAEGWYMDADDTLDSYFLKASGKIGPVNAYVQYQETDLDGVSGEDIELLKAGVSAKMGMFNAAFAYAKTGDDGSGILNAVSTNSAIGYSVSLHKADNSDAIFVDLGAQVSDKLHVGLNYDKVSDDDADEADDHEEAFIQLTYKHAKNLSAYIRYADGEDAELDYNRGRLQVEYKF